MQKNSLSEELVEADHFVSGALTTLKDSGELEITGVAQGNTPETIYFADRLNGKVKRLDLEKRCVEEVHYL